MSKFNISLKFHISACGPDDVNATNCRDLKKIQQKEEEELWKYLNLTDNSEDYQEVSTHEKVFLASVMGIIILLTIIFNLTILVTIFTKPEIRKRGSNWWCFIISLCIADLTVAIAVMPFTMVTYLQQTWIFGEELCYFWCFCDFLCCCASIYCLLFVAINRFMAIANPLDFVWRETKRTFGLVATSWIISFILVLPFLFIVLLDPSSINTEYCAVHYGQRIWFPIYTSLAWYFLPFGAIILLYLGIIFLARKSRIKKLATMAEATISNPEQETLTTGTDNNDGGQMKKIKMNHDSEKIKSILERERHLIKVVVVVLLAFFICWTPFWILTMLVHYCNTVVCQSINDMNQNWFVLIQWMGYSKSMINPIIYTIFQKDIKSSILGSLKKMCSR